jgi:subtilisin family serine protease
MMKDRFLATSGCAIALALGVSACGGGGGGSRPAPTPNPVTPTPTPAPTPAPTPTPTPTPTAGVNYDTTEYRTSNGAVTARAISAYNAGATGKGIKVAVIDSGVNPTVAELSGKIDPASRDVTGAGRPLGDEDGHGTAVSAVIAATRNSSGMLGVAFDSTIIAMKADDPGSCADTSADGGCSFFDSDVATGINAAVNAGAKVINMSLGGGQPNSAVLSAIQRAVDSGVIIVISAGNDGTKPEGVNPDPFALTPARTFPGQVIIAGALDSTAADIASFSNKAGTGAAWYLMALGTQVRTINKNGVASAWSGTSLSAPVISGAVALMAQAFPNLTAQKIIEILFTTADDLGVPGRDATYGNGRLNVQRAFQPIGGTSLAGTGTAIAQSDLPAAAGDGGAQGPSSLGAVILDGYDRAFVLDFAKTLRAASQENQLTRALQGGTRLAGASAGPLSVTVSVAERRDGRMSYAVEKLGIGPEDARASRLIAGSAIARLDSKTAAAFGFREGAKALERRLSGAEAGAFLIARDVSGNPGFSASRGTSMALRRQVGSLGFTVSGETGDVWTEARTSATGSPYRWTSLSVDRNIGRTWLSASLGRLDETQTVLGGRMSAALGGGGSDTMFLDLEARRELGGGFSAGVNARRGWTDFAGGRFRSAAYGADVTKLGVLNATDRLAFRISQPLRVANGGFNLLLPTGYDYETQAATNSRQRFSLSPSGREIDTELSYSTAVLGDSGWLGGNLFMRKDPGHIASADADFGAALRFTLGF